MLISLGGEEDGMSDIGWRRVEEAPKRVAAVQHAARVRVWQKITSGKRESSIRRWPHAPVCLRWQYQPLISRFHKLSFNYDETAPPMVNFFNLSL